MSLRDLLNSFKRKASQEVNQHIVNPVRQDFNTVRKVLTSPVPERFDPAVKVRNYFAPQKIENPFTSRVSPQLQRKTMSQMEVPQGRGRDWLKNQARIVSNIPMGVITAGAAPFMSGEQLLKFNPKVVDPNYAKEVGMGAFNVGTAAVAPLVSLPKALAPMAAQSAVGKLAAYGLTRGAENAIYGAGSRALQGVTDKTGLKRTVKNVVNPKAVLTDVGTGALFNTALSPRLASKAVRETGQNVVEAFVRDPITGRLSAKPGFAKIPGADALSNEARIQQEIKTIKTNLEKSRISRDKKVEKISSEINKMRADLHKGLTEDEYTIYQNKEAELRKQISKINSNYNNESRAVESLINDLEKKKSATSQLKAEWDKVAGVSDNLIQEAKKYKSAEEFVRKIENLTPKNRAEIASKLIGEEVQFTTKTGGKIFYDSPDDYYKIVSVDNLSKPNELKNIKDFSTITKVVAESKNGTRYNFDLRDFAGFKTKSQLTDLWNEAKGSSKKVVGESNLEAKISQSPKLIESPVSKGTLPASPLDQTPTLPNQTPSSFGDSIPRLPEPNKPSLLLEQGRPNTPAEAKKIFRKTGQVTYFVQQEKPGNKVRFFGFQGGEAMFPKVKVIATSQQEKQVPIIFGDYATRTTEAGKTVNIKNKVGEMIPADIQHAVRNGKDRSVQGMLRESPLRNIEDVFGTDGGQKINDYLVRPVAENETNRIRWVKSENDQIKQNVIANIGKKNGLNDQLAFDFAEGKLSLEQLKQATPQWQRVKAAADFGRAKYDEYLRLINETLTKYGYEPIKARQDYVTHIQQIDGFFNMFGSLLNLDKNKLPTVMSSIHVSTRPGKKFFQFALPRKGGEYDKSLIGALETYLPKASEQIFHTDSIQRARLLQKTIEGSVTDMVDQQLSNFNSWLGQYADQLAGKTSILDRGAEKTLGRGVLNASNWARSRVGANMVGASVSSSLTNFIPLTQSLATTNKPAAIRGILEAVTSPFSTPGIIDGVENDFLTRRFTDTSLYKSTGEKAVEGAGALFKAIDRFTSEAVVRGKYYELLKKGLSKKQASEMAGEYAGRIITDRSMGQMPLLFNSKTLGLFTQFQAEVNNQLSTIFKDIPRWSGGNRIKLASALTQVALYSYLYNQLYEKMTGRRPAFDPIGVIQKSYEDYINPNIDKTKATQNLVENISNQLPFVSTLTGGGRIPLSGAIPNVVNIIKGQDMGKELMKPVYYFAPPTGGGQAKKTVEGLRAYVKGASTNASGNVRFPIPQTTGNLLRTGLFGQYSTPEATNYFRTGQTPLSEPQSSIFKAIGGEEATNYYNKTIQNRQQNKTTSKLIDLIKGGKSNKEVQSASLGNDLYQVGDKVYSKTLDKSFDTREEAQIAVNKDTFEKSGKNMQEIDGMVYRRGKDGKAETPITRDEFDIKLNTEKLTSYKKSKNFKSWLETADKQINLLTKQLQDPNVDELDAIDIQNKIDTLVAEAKKYAGYGGFTKGRKAKKPKKLNISLPQINGGAKLQARKSKARLTAKISTPTKPITADYLRSLR